MDGGADAVSMSAVVHIEGHGIENHTANQTTPNLSTTLIHLRTRHGPLGQEHAQTSTHFQLSKPLAGGGAKVHRTCIFETSASGACHSIILSFFVLLCKRTIPPDPPTRAKKDNDTNKILFSAT
jgi:hypothetical protein